MNLYHAGLREIKKFDLSKGCHFGGKNSALEAALRKVPFDTNTIVYLHKVSVPNEVLRIYETFDAGCDENWQSMIEFVIRYGHNAIKYSNKYEPSIYPSFVLLHELSKYLVLNSVTSYQSTEIDKYLCTYV